MSKSVPQSEKNRRRKCSCGCSHLVTRWTEWRHKKNIPSPPSPKQRRITPSFEFDPSLPLLDSPPASNLLQLPGDARTEASGLSADSILLNLHARTHRTTDQSNDEDSEDTLESDAAEAADSVDHETDGFWNGDDVVTQGDMDPCEGIVSDWDLLAEEFIVEAEELGKFKHSLLHTP